MIHARIMKAVVKRWRRIGEKYRVRSCSDCDCGMICPLSHWQLNIVVLLFMMCWLLIDCSLPADVLTPFFSCIAREGVAGYSKDGELRSEEAGGDAGASGGIPGEEGIDGAVAGETVPAKIKELIATM